MKKKHSGLLLSLLILLTVVMPKPTQAVVTSQLNRHAISIHQNNSKTIQTSDNKIHQRFSVSTTIKKPTQPIRQNTTKEITVYTTNTGHKYHRAGCRYLNRSCIPIKLSQAKAEGLTPCSICNPPQ